MKYSKGSGDFQLPTPQRPYEGIQKLQKVPTDKDIARIIDQKKKSKRTQSLVDIAVLSDSEFLTEQFVPDEEKIERIRKQKSHPEPAAPAPPPEPKPAPPPPPKPEPPKK